MAGYFTFVSTTLFSHLSSTTFLSKRKEKEKEGKGRRKREKKHKLHKGKQPDKRLSTATTDTGVIFLSAEGKASSSRISTGPNSNENGDEIKIESKIVRMYYSDSLMEVCA